MWVFLIIVALVLLLLLVRIKFLVSYDASGFAAMLKILFYKMKIPPEKKSKPKPVKKEQEEKKKGAPMSELKDVIGIGFKMLGKVLRTIRVDRLNAEVTIASDDAFKTAMMFGATAAGCGILIPPIENNFNIKKKSINVNADFDAKETLVSFDAKVSVAIWQILLLGVTFVWRYVKLKNTKEGKI